MSWFVERSILRLTGFENAETADRPWCGIEGPGLPNAHELGAHGGETDRRVDALRLSLRHGLAPGRSVHRYLDLVAARETGNLRCRVAAADSGAGRRPGDRR